MLDITSDIKDAAYFAIVIDETQDIASLEQCAVVIRFIDEEYCIREELVGLFQADNCDAESLTNIIKTVLLSLDLNIKLLRGQTYDGAKVLQGKFSGVAKRIKDVVGKAISLHCLNHGINLTLQEAAKVNGIVSNTLSVVQEVCVVIRASAKRLAVFKSMQSGQSNPTSIKPLCPTRWCCHVRSLESIHNNYEAIADTIDWLMEHGNKQTEAFKKAPGLLALMTKFSTWFGLNMCLCIFSPIEQLAKQLQAKDITAQAVSNAVGALKRYLQSLRSESHFDKLYEKCLASCDDLNVGSPEGSLPRKRKAPRHLEDYLRVDGCSSSVDHEFATTKQYYRQSFFEFIDLVVESLDSRFEQSSLDHLQKIEKLILSASNGEFDFNTSPADLEKQFPILVGDIDFRKLCLQLELLPDSFQQVMPKIKKVTLISTVVDFMKEPGMKMAFSQLHTLLQLYLTIPLSNASSERAFSVLRRVKNYLRSSMNQKHTNHFVMLHAHKALTDALDVREIAKSFIAKNERRVHYFGAFQ